MRERRFFGNARTAELQTLVSRVQKLATSSVGPQAQEGSELLSRLKAALAETEQLTTRQMACAFKAACE
jgi:hypothetical protein